MRLTAPWPAHAMLRPRAQDPLLAGSGPPQALSRDQAPGSTRFCRTLCSRSWQHCPVRIEKTDLADVLVLVPQPFRDGRGLFTRTFDADIFDDYLVAPGTSA